MPGSLGRYPALRPRLAIGKRKGGLKIAVGFLRGQDDGNPAFEGGSHMILCGEYLGIAAGVDHERQAHRFNRLMDPCVGEDIALMRAMLLAAQCLGGFHEVVDTTLPCREIGPLTIGNAMRDPVDDQGLNPSIPERIIDRVWRRIDDIQAAFRWRSHDAYADARGNRLAGGHGCHPQHVFANLRETRACFGCGGILERRLARAAFFVPAQHVALAGFEPANLCGEIGAPTKNHAAIDPRIYDRRQHGLRSCRPHPPASDTD